MFANRAMNDNASTHTADCPAGHAIIAGFGLPGRAVAEVLAEQHQPFCVIELNARTVTRCHQGGLQIIEGDVMQEDTLRRAGIERASLLVLAIPDEHAAVEAVRIARQLNPHVRIIARCHYTSAGMTATRLGADTVIVAEQVVAEALKQVVRALPTASSSA